MAASFGLGLEPGDEIIVGEGEHHANLVPWHFLRERHGIVLKFIPVDEDGVLDLDAYRALLGPKTRMVAVSHMSNVTGATCDVAAVVAGARSVGARVLLDGAQAVVHQKIDVTRSAAISTPSPGYKLYGPTGIGVLWQGRRPGRPARPTRAAAR